MTIIEAINLVDSQKPNAYSQSEKIAWLSTIDGMIKKLIIDTHEDGDDITFSGYTDDTDLDTELLAPFPFDELYFPWLESKIDYTNGEYTKYNNSITRFNDSFASYRNFYNQQHMPIGTKLSFF